MEENQSFEIDGYEFMNYKQRKWLKIFEHNASFGFFNQSLNDAYYNLDPNLYSIIKYIPKIRRPSSQYTFILRYPGHEGENIFSQCVTPFNTYTTKESMCLDVESDSWTGDLFRGLMLSKYNNTFMQCSQTQYWHFAIGAYHNYTKDKHFPGPRVDINGKNQYSFVVNKAVLWIEIKSFTNVFDICVCTIKNSNYFQLFKYSFISVFISM